MRRLLDEARQNAADLRDHYDMSATALTDNENSTRRTAPIPLRLNLAGSPGCAGRMWVVADSTRDAQAALDGRR